MVGITFYTYCCQISGHDSVEPTKTNVSIPLSWQRQINLLEVLAGHVLLAAVWFVMRTSTPVC